MKVFVETNFVLEMAYEQEQSRACEALLQLAEAKALQLIIPAFCFIEPADTLRRRIHAHRELQEKLENELEFRQRSSSFAEAHQHAWSAVISSLVVHTQEVEERLETFHCRLIQCSEVVSVSKEIITRATEFKQSGVVRHFPDAVVLASVMARLEGEPRATDRSSLFLNRNVHDFDVSSVKQALQPLHCKLITSFNDGLSAVESRLRPRPV